MHLILFLVLGMLGLWRFGISGGLTGVLIGLLLAQVLQLRNRIAVLEKSAALKQAPESMKEKGVVFGPAGATTTLQETGNRARFTPTRPVSLGEKVSESMVQLDSPTIFARLFRGLGVDAPRLIQLIRQFFTSGNLVVKSGVIILFFGVAFLLKYAAQRNMLPIELRLIGVAVSGVAALGCGWWLRQSKTGYGLVLQGGGVGILYLVVFAAARLYDFLPMPLSLTVMIGLVGLSGLLAVLQEAKSLAIFGVVGGFLAPVLMTTGGGSHVLLFSYYALLNAGILGIAWFKSWRELNLLGFIVSVKG